MRDIWSDHASRQAFEHELVDRKTTWLLTTQGLLFTAYGVTFQAAGRIADAHLLNQFRDVVAAAGFALAIVVLFGVMALLNSKRLAWKEYRTFFSDPQWWLPRKLGPPRPLDSKPLQWGVHTWNSLFTMLPDVLIPGLFIGTWAALLW
jgi:hypothetical protein